MEDELEELGHYADWSSRLQLYSCLRQDVRPAVRPTQPHVQDTRVYSSRG